MRGGEGAALTTNGLSGAGPPATTLGRPALRGLVVVRGAPGAPILPRAMHPSGPPRPKSRVRASGGAAAGGPDGRAMSLVSDVRARVDAAIFTKVAGADAFEKRERIHRTPGPRWFPPGAAIRRVHDNASMYPGGIRALLLQSLHPLAMAAVAQHSGYRSDVWGRLARTSTFLATTTFGTAEDAQRAVDVVRAVHARVAGTAPDGRPYRADDPHLLTWIHVAEIDSFLTAHTAYGRDPLTAAQRDAYVADAAVVARALGAVDVPTTTAQLAATIERYRPELATTPEALDVAQFLLREAPIPRAARPLYAVLAAGAVDLLPPWARDLLGLPHRGPVRRALVRAATWAMLALMGWVARASREPGT